jgi:virginiamycin B lyase
MRRLAFSMAAIVLASVACHANSGTPGIPIAAPDFARAGATAKKGGNVTVTLLVPAHAANPAGIAIAVYARWLGGAPPLKTITGSVAAGAKSCKAGKKERTCALAAKIPPGGPYEMVVTLYNKAPVDGSFPGAKRLGGAVLAQSVRAGTVHTGIGLTTAPLVSGASIGVQAVAPLHAFDPGNAVLIVTGLDAAGNAIVAKKFKAAKGAARIAISADASAGPAFSFAHAIVTKPQAGAVRVAYAPSAVSPALIPTGFAATFTATPSVAGAKAGSTTLRVPPPAFLERKLSNTNAYPYTIAAGPDGAMWFGEFNAGKMGRITTSMQLTNELSGFDHPQSIAIGPDNALWVSNDGGSSAISRIVPGATIGVTQYPLAVNTYPVGIARGPRGVLWFASQFNNYVSWIDVAGTPGPAYALPAHAIPVYCAEGSDANVYVTLNHNYHGEIAQVTPTGTVAHIFPIPGRSPSPQSIILGPDKKVWFTDTNQGAIFSMTNAGAFKKFRVNAASAPDGPLTVGPDAAIWFTAGRNQVGRLDVSSGKIVFLTLPRVSDPLGIAVGPDGAFYVTEDLPSAIARIQ